MKTSVLAAPTIETPFIGREHELAILRQAISEAKAGRGSAWTIEAPGGMGKTRLVRQAEKWAAGQAVRSSWGYCLKEVMTGFFAFQQMFRPGFLEPTAEELPDPLPAVLFVMESRPELLTQALPRLSKAHPTLVVSRETPGKIRARSRGIDPTTRFLGLSREPGEELVAPGDLDGLGEVLSKHLSAGEGRLVLLSGLQYLTSQNEVSSVTALVHFLRDAAEASRGHLLVVLNPAHLEARELATLVGGDLVLGAPGASVVPDFARTAPSTVMLELLSVLEKASAAQPRLLVLDDLQWADPSSLRTFQFLARNVRQLPVVVVATLRSDAVRQHDDPAMVPLRETLEAMDREGTLQRIPLRGLGDDQGAELAEALFGHRLAQGVRDPTLRTLLERAKGSPFFLQESLRQLAEAGQVQLDGEQVRLAILPGAERRERGQIGIPETLVRLVARRLEGLSPEERLVLEWAAIAGAEFDLAPVAAVLQRTPSSLLPIVEHLEQRFHLVERHPEVAGNWSFGHPLVWEVTNAGIDPAVFRERSLALAVWWQERRPHELDTVARLFHDARDPLHGDPWVRRAIDAAQETHASETIERLLGWLDDLMEVQGRSVDQRVTEGLSIALRLFRETGPSAPLARMYEQLLARGPTRELRATVVARQAEGLLYLDSRKSAADLAELRKEIATWDAVPDPVRIALELSTARLRDLFQDPAAVESAEAALRLLGPHGNPWDVAAALYAGSWILVHLGRFDEAEGWLTRLAKVAESFGRPRPLSQYYTVAATMHESQGELLLSEEAYRSSLVEGRRAGNYLGVCVGTDNMAGVQLLRGDLASTLEASDEVERLALRFDFRHQVAAAKSRRGAVFLRQGRLEEARSEISEALTLLGDPGPADRVALCRTDLAEVLLALGSVEEARRLVEGSNLDSALWIEERIRPPLIRAWAAEVSGRATEARGFLDEALRFALSRKNPVFEARTKSALGRWEVEHGDPARGRALLEESSLLFDRCDVLPSAWVRAWPPGPA